MHLMVCIIHKKGNKNMHLGENVYHNNNIYNCQNKCSINFYKST